MASDIPKDRTVAALAEVWASTSELLTSLPADEWSQPSPLPGWSVQDNVSHIVGTEAMLLGESNPDVTIDRQILTHVSNDIGEFNEVWVEHLRSAEPSVVLSQFNEFTLRRVEALEAMPLEEWHAESLTPARRDTYGRFMQIRVFDCWLHEQDIRDATGRPGNETGLAADVTLDEMTTALGFVVGKKAGLAEGQSVTFELTDRGVPMRSFHVAIEGRAKVVESLSGDATATLTMPVGTMTRLCAGRAALESLRAGIDVAGNVELGERVLSNLNYTI